MPANYVLLERIELNASASSISFTNIPQSGYTDLKIVASTRDTRSNVANGLILQFNGSSTGFTSRVIEGSGASAYSFTDTQGLTGENTSATATSNTFSSTECYIPNYTSSNNKSFSFDSVTENNATTAYADLGAGLWSNTAAITSITLTSLNSASFVQYSTFSLYGLAALGTTPVIAPKASGGNIQTDGTYWYHTFLTTGAFVPATTLSCDALVIAGGGGGGAYSGGGGGAGGLLAFTSQSFAASTSYTVTVGSGGAGGGNSSGGTGYGSNGTDSQLGALTLVLAGGGGGSSKSGGSRAGQAGGSGGGGTNSFNTGGAGTSGQGFAGGNYASSGGGGGGGSAEAGNTDGVYLGGDGLSTYSSWGLATVTGQNISGTVYYAGGGDGDSSGAATGGAGGGGAASTNGTTNTGGGGGAWNGSGSAGNGGSGIVIIRYTIA
jgi:hypothetical protein